MKNKTVTFSLALSMCLLVTLTSCQKDSLAITDLEPTSQEVELVEDIDQVEPVLGIGSTDQNVVLTNPNNLADMIAITLTTTPCTNGGYSVTVTSSEANLGNGEYTIRWYMNTQQTVYAEGQTIECVCGAGFRVEVYDQVGDLSAEGSLDVPSC